ncbi:hypothetical protein ACFPYJ_11260 [Paenibacillus solisilvae]|uniref:Sugar phosphate isomerase/epimerase n=1 Tax=Paenibacillus solisilvae TaxID=2486751 RepID=A0ABW0VZU5_9BACL
MKEDYNGRKHRSKEGRYYAPVIAGQGCIDLRQILTKLKQADYDEWVSVEFEGEEDGKIGSVASIDYLKELIQTFD